MRELFESVLTGIHRFIVVLGSARVYSPNNGHDRPAGCATGVTRARFPCPRWTSAIGNALWCIAFAGIFSERREGWVRQTRMVDWV